MKATLQAIDQARIELGIKYKKIQIENVDLKNIKKIVEKNEDYALSKSELLESELDKVYQYNGQYQALIQDGKVIIDDLIIGNVKEGNRKKLEGQTVDCTIYGGNYKRITKKDDDPVNVILTHSTIYHVELEIKE